MKGWRTSVYQVNLDDHPDGKFVAFFMDDESANLWLNKTEDPSIYEVRTK